MQQAIASSQPRVRLGKHSLAVILPRAGDPRLRLAAVVISLQVLGQVALGFKVSIAQIIVSVGACAIVEMAISFHRERVIAWPASALLTGNSVAFILRTIGTRHGDWWSLNGAELFLFAAVGGLLSKYLVKPGGRQLFNPSNLGLVACLLIAGPDLVFPQYLWWGSSGFPVVIALAVILAGGAWALRGLGMLPMLVTFLLTFEAFVAVLAVGGGCFFAVWHDGPICGSDYWLAICSSPELLVFVLFMMSDPKTAPASAGGRALYGFAVAAIAGIFISIQPSEYGVKVGLLAALTVVCTFTPLLDGFARRAAAASIRSAAGYLAAATIVITVTAGVYLLSNNLEALAIDHEGTTAVSAVPTSPSPSPTPASSPAAPSPSSNPPIVAPTPPAPTPSGPVLPTPRVHQ